MPEGGSEARGEIPLSLGRARASETRGRSDLRPSAWHSVTTDATWRRFAGPLSTSIARRARRRAWRREGTRRTRPGGPRRGCARARRRQPVQPRRAPGEQRWRDCKRWRHIQIQRAGAKHRGVRELRRSHVRFRRRRRCLRACFSLRCRCASCPEPAHATRAGGAGSPTAAGNAWRGPNVNVADRQPRAAERSQGQRCADGQ